MFQKSLLAAVLFAGSALLDASAFAASVFTETFSTPGNTSGWTAVNGQLNLAGNSGVLNYTPSSGSFSSDFINADAGSSSGAFVGALSGLGNLVASFDFFLANGSQLNGIALDLFNGATGEEWQFAFATPAAGTLSHFMAPLTTLPGADSTGWTQISGSRPFDFILANTSDFAILLTGSGAGPSGFVDNVSIIAVPEPATVAGGMAGLGLVGMALMRLRRARPGTPN